MQHPGTCIPFTIEPAYRFVNGREFPEENAEKTGNGRAGALRLRIVRI